ncbi:MAG: glycosyltransferase family 2 protein [Dysgonomonas sp.]
MSTDILISVLTPVYNRADKIHRVFDSLEKSTYRNFELIILDDGSTDNIEEVVNEYKQKVTYPVTFLRKENEGKHVALNILHQMAKGKYVFQLDSDDEIMPDAMETALKVWDNIDPAKKDDYWCVLGRVIDQHERKMQGELFDEGVNNLEWDEIRKIMKKNQAEKWGLQRTDVLRKYKLPEPKGITFVMEGLLWDLIQNDYKEYLTNEIFRVYYINDGDCLTQPIKNIQWAKNKYYSRLYSLNRGKTYKIPLKEYWTHIAYVSICYLLLSKEDMADMEEKPTFKNKLAMAFAIPPIYICLPLIKKKMNWKYE